MKIPIIILFLASSCCVGNMAFDQPLIPFDSLVAVNHHEIHKHNFASYFRDCSNEPQFIITAFFIGYKTFLSSQDGKSCTFTPSCSVYAIQTIRKKGFLLGILDAVDRLTRCNGLTPENYEIDPDLKLLVDYP